MFLVEAGLWPEVGEVELGAEVPHAPAQNVESPTSLDLLGESLEEPLFDLFAVLDLELLPRLGLGSVDEAEESLSIEATRAVVVLLRISL